MIEYLIISILVFIYYILIFFLWGTMFLKKAGIEHCSLMAFIVGCFSYFICFNLAALPMKLTFCSLSELAWLWLLLVTTISLIMILKNRNYLKQILKDFSKSLKHHPFAFVGMLVIFLIQYIYIGSQTGRVIGVTDDMYYIGDVTTSVYTNTIQQFEYMTGEKLSYLLQSYLLQMYPVHSAVICWLTNLPPLIENKWILTAVWILLVDSVYLLWGRLLFKGNTKKCFMFIGIITWVVFCQRKANGSFAAFMIYRTAEGKNLLANLIIPFLIYIFARIVMSNGKKQDWQLLFITVVASYCFVMSSMFILPFVLGSFYVCYILWGRRWHMLGNAVICFIPCIVVLCIYLLLQKWILTFPVP